VTRSLHRLTTALLLGFLLLAAVTGYWALAAAPALLAREDNPRPIEQLRRIARGPILARDGTLLAVATPGAGPGAWARSYPVPEAAPAVGYASLKHGTAGIEEAYDAVLLGLAGRDPVEAARDDLLHRLPAGRGVRLTLDPRVQSAAEHALGAFTGAIVVLDAQTGEVLALASHPAYDPNRLEEQFEALSRDPAAPLVNRTTQSAYQPGPTLEPALVAEALDRGVLAPEEIVTGAGRPLEAGLTLACAGSPPHPDLDAGAALAYACPAFAGELGRRLGAAALDGLFARLGLFDAPGLPLRTAVSAHPPLPAGDQDLLLAAAGQGALTVTPLHIALVTAALAGDGTTPAPRLVDAVQGTDGAWQPVAAAPPRALFGYASAAQVRAWLRSAVSGPGPAHEAWLSTVPVAGHAGIALSGSQAGVPVGLAWFSGFTLGERPIVVTVLIEHSTDARTAAEVARSVFAAATP
jgi:peptidoglycan glycosyltransferase